MPRCPDGRRNAWELAVPNGVYSVTVNLLGNGCTFENVRAKDQGIYGSSSLDTYVYSVEVSDGRFTMSAVPSRCKAVNWMKIDLLSTKVYPKPWLPSPSKEWLQIELPDSVDVGLVEIRVIHEGYTLATSYPHAYEYSFPDCRQWWLYAPAKCFRMFMSARKYGVHPDLITYPHFPGFTKPFLEWLYDEHDKNGDGVMTYEEFRSSASDIHKTGTYSMWGRPGKHNYKGTQNYHDDNAKHLWSKLDTVGLDHGRDGKLTRDEFTNGVLSMPLHRFCDLFENTGHTHGTHNRSECMVCEMT